MTLHHSMNKWKVLYGLSSAGKIKVWNIEVQGTKNVARIIITHGEEHGKQQTTIRRVQSGKHIGKANETTPYEQAVLEAQAFWNKKKDKGYRTDRKELIDHTRTATRLPMLALKYQDRAHDLVWPVYVQPKLNGIRCLMERQGNEILFHSRGGKQFTTLDHIKHDALIVMKDGEILDGELYCHTQLTFQELVSLIKNDKKKEENKDKLRKYVKFWNYDRCEDKPFRERAESLVSYGSIWHVPTWLAHTEDEVTDYHRRFASDGYEGTMVRSGGDEPYQFQYRSPTLLKLKDFQDEEFEIVGVKEGLGKDEGKATFTCRMKDGQTFDVRCKGTDEEREEQWQNRNQYIGRQITVKFQYYSDAGIPIFPVGIGIRDYE